LEKFSWATEKNVYCAVAGWNTLSFIRSVVSFNSTVSLWIFWSGWSIYWWLRSVEVFHHHYFEVYFCFLVQYYVFNEVGCPKFGYIKVNSCYFLLIYFASISMKLLSLSLLTNLGLESTLSEVSIASLVHFQESLAWKIFFPPCPPKAMFVSVCMVGFL
jgi:hypothetical protein